MGLFELVSFILILFFEPFDHKSVACFQKAAVLSAAGEWLWDLSLQLASFPRGWKIKLTYFLTLIATFHKDLKNSSEYLKDKSFFSILAFLSVLSDTVYSWT